VSGSVRVNNRVTTFLYTPQTIGPMSHRHVPARVE
jgi:hypothetical protein